MKNWITLTAMPFYFLPSVWPKPKPSCRFVPKCGQNRSLFLSFCLSYSLRKNTSESVEMMCQRVTQPGCSPTIRRDRCFRLPIFDFLSKPNSRRSNTTSDFYCQYFFSASSNTLTSIGIFYSCIQ